MMSTARSCQPSRAVRLAILGLGLAMLQPALARKDDRQKPANIAAKSFDATQQANGVIHYKGNVLLTQGTLKATGALATAYLDADNSVTRVVITGTPAHIEQLDDSGNLMQGDASAIDYDNVKQVAVLTGNASVKQKGRGEAQGDKLTYNTQTSQMTGESSGDGMVHMTFQPKPKPAAPAASSSTTPASTTPAPAQSSPVPAQEQP
jgi:lipopolysaccharide export system protein LptA